MRRSVRFSSVSRSSCMQPASIPLSTQHGEVMELGMAELSAEDKEWVKQAAALQEYVNNVDAAATKLTADTWRESLKHAKLALRVRPDDPRALDLADMAGGFKYKK